MERYEANKVGTAIGIRGLHDGISVSARVVKNVSVRVLLDPVREKTRPSGRLAARSTARRPHVARRSVVKPVVESVIEAVVKIARARRKPIVECARSRIASEHRRLDGCAKASTSAGAGHDHGAPLAIKSA